MERGFHHHHHHNNGGWDQGTGHHHHNNGGWDQGWGNQSHHHHNNGGWDQGMGHHHHQRKYHRNRKQRTVSPGSISPAPPPLFPSNITYRPSRNISPPPISSVRSPFR